MSLCKKCANEVGNDVLKWRRNINLSDHSFHHLALTGEMAKQMKVKKLKNLKTLDSKPGRYFTSPFYSIYFSVL